MRIRIPRRFLLLAILLASLALVATSVATTPSYAKPIGWDDPNNPPPNKGDSDGGLQKSGSIAPLATRDSATGSVTRTSWTTVRMYLLAMRLGYGWRWTW